MSRASVSRFEKSGDSDQSGFPPWLNQTNDFTIDACRFLARHLPLLDWLVQCQDNVSEKDISSWYGGLVSECGNTIIIKSRLPIQRIFNLPHHMVWEELPFDDVVSYTQRWKWITAQLNIMAVKGFVPGHQGYQLSYLPTHLLPHTNIQCA